jgi:hypothetical protein
MPVRPELAAWRSRKVSNALMEQLLPLLAGPPDQD